MALPKNLLKDNKIEVSGFPKDGIRGKGFIGIMVSVPTEKVVRLIKRGFSRLFKRR